MLLSDRFTVGMLSDDEGETIVRFRASIPESLRDLLPNQFIVEWSFRESNEKGLPGPEEMFESEDFGRELCETLERYDDALLAFMATGNSVREWYFYCRDVLKLQERFNTLANGRPFPIELHAGYDPAWRVYREFTSAFDGDV